MPDIRYADHHQVLDALVSKHFGDESGYVEAVLDANPGLAESVRLPMGTPVVLPDLAKKYDTIPVVTLWE